MKRFLACLPLVFAGALSAQADVPAPASAQPRFLVADVHASATAPGFVQTFGGVLRGGLYLNRDATMLDLIASAYGIPEDAMAGGPGWVGADLFDVVAKVPEGTTAATAKLMLQALLAERFGLVIRTETRPIPRYVLSVGKGSKLKPAAGSAEAGCDSKDPVGPPPSDPAQQPNIKVSCHNLTAAAIAENLHEMAGGYLDHDVVDQTKLQGVYDFDLEWTSRGALTAKGPDGISIFDAVSKQLGLKLEVQNIAMPTLAIAHVNRVPSPNPASLGTALAVPLARFEVASIKPADPKAEPFKGLLYTGGSQMRAGGTLRFMIAMSLQIPANVANDVLVGLPKFADTQVWDIQAKVPATGEGAPTMVNGRLVPPPFSVGLEMLRGLLLDQFALKSHTENREVTVYALTAIGKTKLTRADEAERTGCKVDANLPRPVPNSQPVLVCKNLTMSGLSDLLKTRAQGYIDHPIVDATGLEGGWDFTVGWTGKGVMDAASAEGGDGGASSLSVFEAVEKQLGLKLVKEKRSIPVIVVDHVEEKPIE